MIRPSLKKITAALLVIMQAVPYELRAGNESIVEAPPVPEMTVLDRGQAGELPEMSSIYDFKRVADPQAAPSISDIFGRSQTTQERAPVTFPESEVRTLIPKFIAQMEAAFPNLQYVFLGRDSALVGRAVQAFYLSRGENDRVIFLDVSEGLYEKMSDADKAGLLESNGFKITKGTGLERPFVICDGTDSQEKSQSIGLRKAATEMLLQAGVSWDRIRTKLAVVNLSDDIKNQVQFPNKLKEIKSFVSTQQLPSFEKQKVGIDTIIAQKNGPLHVWVDLNILQIRLNTLLHYQIVHGPYVSPKVDLGARFGGAPSGETKDSPRAGKEKWISYDQAVYEMQVLAEIMSSPDTLANVQRAASEIGYEFKSRKMSDPDILSVNEAEARAKGTDLVSRRKLLEFLKATRLSEAEYRKIFSALEFDSAHYRSQFAELMQQPVDPTIIAMAELFIAYDGLQSAKAQTGLRQYFEKSRIAALTALERSAIDAMERVMLFEIFRNGSAARASYFDSIGRLFIDPSNQSLTQKISKSILARYNRETPTFKENISKKTPLGWVKREAKALGGARNASKGVVVGGTFTGELLTGGAAAVLTNSGMIPNLGEGGMILFALGGAAAGAAIPFGVSSIRSFFRARSNIKSSIKSTANVGEYLNSTLIERQRLVREGFAHMCSLSVKTKK